MADIKSWNVVDGDNDGAAPAGWPEGMLPDGVNDSGRAVMGGARRWYEEAEWLELVSAYAINKGSDTMFRVLAFDATAYFPVGMRVRVDDASTSIFGYVTAATYATNTEVTVAVDGGGVIQAVPTAAFTYIGRELRSGAFAPTGTDPTDVPTNADLGSASLVDTGTDSADVPTVADLLSIPGVYYGENAIINGNFDIWQRRTLYASISSGGYRTADRWRVSLAGSGRIRMEQSSDVPDGGSEYSLHLSVATADGTIGASDHYMFSTRIEGYDAQRFDFGVAAAKSLTLNFWVKSDVAGIYCVAIRNRGTTDRSYVANYTIDAGGVWEEKTITVPGDTTGTWLRTNGIGIEIAFSLAAGSNFLGADGTWDAANNLSVAGHYNFMQDAANDIWFSRIQATAGSAAMPFQRRTVAQELVLCERYYCKSYNTDVDIGTATGVGRKLIINVIAAPRWAITFPVTMRGTPTLSTWNPNDGTSGEYRDESGSVDVAITAIPAAGESGCSVEGASAGAPDKLVAVHWAADAEL